MRKLTSLAVMTFFALAQTAAFAGPIALPPPAVPAAAGACLSDRVLPQPLPGVSLPADPFDVGMDYLDNGQPGRAMREFTKAIRLNSSDWEALDERGMLFYALGYPERALKDVDRAVSLKEGDACLHVDRAQVHEALGNADAALADYDAALSIRPGLIAARNAREMLIARLEKRTITL